MRNYCGYNNIDYLCKEEIENDVERYEAIYINNTFSSFLFGMFPEKGADNSGKKLSFSLCTNPYADTCREAGGVSARPLLGQIRLLRHSLHNKSRYDGDVASIRNLRVQFCRCHQSGADTQVDAKGIRIEKDV